MTELDGNQPATPTNVTKWAIVQLSILAIGYIGLMGGNTIAGVAYITFIWLMILRNALIITISTMFSTPPTIRQDIPIGLHALNSLATSYILLAASHRLAATLIVLILITGIIATVRKTGNGSTNNQGNN